MRREIPGAKHERIKQEISRSAAQLLFNEEVRSYRDARSQAVRRASPGASVERGAHLPEYHAIHVELQALFLFYGGNALAERVRRYRQLALKYLLLLEPFEPLLVGSVQRGEVREISDINLQLFSDRPEEVGYFLENAAIMFSEEGDAKSVRFYLEDEGVEIACVVCPLNERRQRPHCRITGKQMERTDAKRLRALLDETPEA